jgi:hypothetical protein
VYYIKDISSSTVPNQGVVKKVASGTTLQSFNENITEVTVAVIANTGHAIAQAARCQLLTTETPGDFRWDLGCTK